MTKRQYERDKKEIEEYIKGKSPAWRMWFYARSSLEILSMLGLGMVISVYLSHKFNFSTSATIALSIVVSIFFIYLGSYIMIYVEYFSMYRELREEGYTKTAAKMAARKTWIDSND